MMNKIRFGVSLVCLSAACSSAFANACTDHLNNYVSADRTILSLSNCGVTDKLLTDKVIPFLNANPSISWLYIPYNSVDGAGLNALVQHNSTITKLDVSYNYHAGNGAAFLAGKQNLGELAMWGDNIGPNEASALANNTALKILDLGENAIGIQGSAAFAANTTLQFLGVSLNSLTLDEVAKLSSNQSLQALDISNNNLGPAAAAYLNKMTSLTYLDVSVNHLGDQGAESFANNASLMTLFIGNNYISSTGAEALATIPGLVQLDIDTNKIRTQGLASLVNKLHYLEWLDAHDDEITSAAELAKMPALSYLILNDNPLDVETGVSLAKDPVITNLYLAKTGLTDDSAYVFAKNNTLWQLDVSYNAKLSAAAVTAMLNNPNFSLPDHWLWTQGDNVSGAGKRRVLPEIAAAEAKCGDQQTLFCKNLLASRVNPKVQQ
jgi:Leucine-rich repeat (LRR) protein